MDKYNHKKIEKHWQKEWEKEKLYEIKDKEKGKKNFYQLVEFPYPSGNLHVGHWYAFSVPDIFARAKRMQGYNVLYPMGFDAFGLPAENAAIKNNTNPRKWTEGNIEYMKKQLSTMGASFDWSREVRTTDPEYYRWTQWMFLEFFKSGLAYQAETSVNWCPSCKTVLANEQVVQGFCERCGSEVEQKVMRQWQLKISEYAEELLKDLEGLDWPEAIKEGQRNWIGKSEGARVNFPLSKKYNYVLLHGYTGTNHGVFFKWLQNELKKQGLEYQAPQLPNSENPTEEEQVQYVLENVKFDENTILFGHSLGAVVALKVLEKLNKKIAGLVTAGGFIEHNFKDRPRPFHKTFSWNFDFEKIKQNSDSQLVLSATNDYAVPIEQGRILSEKLDCPLLEVEAEDDHFTNSEEPVILESLVPSIKVFTTRPDTIYGATYMVLAPENPLISSLKSQIINIKEVEDYVKKALKKTERQRQEEEKQKTGVELKGVKAINPATKQEIPIWVADYVLGSVGTGAIMAVPAHDARDHEFAAKYQLPTRQVVEPPRITGAPESNSDLSASAFGHLNTELEAEAWTGDGTLTNSGEFSGEQSDEARKKIANKYGKAETRYRMRDWIISRQRYWGVPIPLVFCEHCAERIKNYELRIKNTKRQLIVTRAGKDFAIIPIPEGELPVELPELQDFRPVGDGKSPLAKVEDWVRVTCPSCGKDAERETDTMDTFVDSSWYFLRYLDPKNKKKFADEKKLKKWMPVDRYSGGAEHTTMHVLYSRFWVKALHRLGHLPWNEPYKVRMNRGLILGPDGAKMSKSKGNVVNPDEYVEKLGADTVRMYLAFIGPYNEVGTYPWDAKGIMGIRRFLDNVWKAYSVTASEAKQSQSRNGIASADLDRPRNDVKRLLHKTIKKVTEDIEAFKFNTAIAAMMSFINKAGSLDEESAKSFLKLLAPFAPHMAEEIWREVLGHKKSIHLEQWPEYDEKLVKEERVKLPVQINGKVRATIEVDSNVSEEEVKKLAESDEKVQKYLADKQVKKFVYIKDRIANFVTS